MKKKTIPKASLRNWADRMITVLRAFKIGRQIQRKTSLINWHDFDLSPFLRGGAVKYRVKRTKK